MNRQGIRQEDEAPRLRPYRCARCGLTVHATMRPTPISWSDGSVCEFREPLPPESDKAIPEFRLTP